MFVSLNAHRVKAVNREGEASDTPIIQLGYSGEDTPQDSPGNLRLIKDIDGDGRDDAIVREAIVEWEPVDPARMRGEFKGYRIIAWVEGEKEAKKREMVVGPDQTRTKIDILMPNAQNLIEVVAFNNDYDSQPSPQLKVKTAEGRPGPVREIAAYPMGPSALYIQWKEPLEPNGLLTAYQVDYAEVNGTGLGARRLWRNLTDARVRATKMTGLKPLTKYRVWVAGYTRRGLGEYNFIEQRTDVEEIGESTMDDGSAGVYGTSPYTLARMPGIPDFAVRALNNRTMLVEWIPFGERLGEYFYVQYKRKGDGNWMRSKNVLYDMSTMVENLPPATYIVRVVSVEGRRETPSNMKYVRHSLRLLHYNAVYAM